jgi:trehalose 6-phosphate synthase
VTGIRIQGRSSSYSVELPERTAHVGTFPIGIDFEQFERAAASEATTREMLMTRDRMPNIHLVLGIDRLDYTKGLPERIVAFREMLRRYPEHQGQVSLIQVVIPSREDVPEYQQQRADIERLVGEVNGEFAQPGWTPVQYMYRSLTQQELMAYYRMSEVCLVTPLKDGMNLVSKEYCACNVDGDGVLILSEFAGSAAQLHGSALMVNPYDIEGTADAIHQAFVMPSSQRRARMRRLRAIVRKDNIFWWTDSFLRASISRGLDDFPASELFVPQADITELTPIEDER